MFDETHWTNKSIRQAEEEYPQVPSEVSERMENLFAGPFSERELSKGDRDKYAKQLLKLIEPEQSGTEAEP